jgi:hypothetical protein
VVRVERSGQRSDPVGCEALIDVRWKLTSLPRSVIEKEFEEPVRTLVDVAKL